MVILMLCGNVRLTVNAGLGHLIARTEDEYVRSALQLASDASALAELRMTLREQMMKSPVCDGAKFAHGLESAYRSMWHRYCNGDMPALRLMEMMQQQQPLSEQVSVKFSEAKADTAQENHLGPVKMNGVSSVASSTPNPSSCKENGN